MGKKIGVLTAMSVEFKQIASILTDTKLEKIGPQEFLTGKLDDKTIVLLQCGIGKGHRYLLKSDGCSSQYCNVLP